MWPVLPLGHEILTPVLSPGVKISHEAFLIDINIILTSFSKKANV